MKRLSDTDLVALPERSAIAARVIPCIDPETGMTHMRRLPVIFVPNDSDVFSFRDHDGIVWRVGKDQDGYFKSRV